MVWWDGRRYNNTRAKQCVPPVYLCLCVCARTWASGLYFYREQTKWKIEEKKTLVAAAIRMLFSSIFELRENEHTIHTEMGDRPFALYLSLSFPIILIFVKFFRHRYIWLTCYRISLLWLFFLCFSFSLLKYFLVDLSANFFLLPFLSHFCLRQTFCYSITFVLFQASITLMILWKLFKLHFSSIFFRLFYNFLYFSVVSHHLKRMQMFIFVSQIRWY